jgi:hypothetical protein
VAQQADPAALETKDRYGRVALSEQTLAGLEATKPLLGVRASAGVRIHFALSIISRCPYDQDIWMNSARA